MQDKQWDTYNPEARPQVRPFTEWETYDPDSSRTEEAFSEPEAAPVPEEPKVAVPEEPKVAVPEEPKVAVPEEPEVTVPEGPEPWVPEDTVPADLEDQAAADGETTERVPETEPVPADGSETSPETPAEAGQETPLSAQEESCEPEPAATVQEEKPEDSSGKQWEIESQLTQLNLRMEQLDRKFNEKIKVSESQDIMAKTLYAEVQEYKKGMYGDILKPLLLELVQLRNNIFRQCRSIMEKEGEDAMISIAKLLDYGEDIGDVLEAYDVEIFRGEPGTDFDPKLQKLLKKVPATDAALNKKVAASLCDGYRYRGRTIMKENVKVYVYEPDTEKTEAARTEQA